MSGRRVEPARETVFIENITVPANRARAVDAEGVARLVESMKVIGLQSPITVRLDGADLLLVAGLHRFEAAKALGWERIDAIYIDGDETDARLWEISENLHRVELQPVERAEHINEWRLLTVAKVLHDVGPDRGQPLERGHGKTAASLGVSTATVHRAEKIASLPQETRDTARVEGWSQKRLLETAAPPKPVPPAPEPRNDLEAIEMQVTRLMSAWNAAGPDARADFLARIDAPVFDRGRAA